jgi:hypothetical protein
MQSQSTANSQISTGNPQQESGDLDLTNYTREGSSKNQEELNKNDNAGKDIPKWPFGQEEALKETDQQKEAVEEYIAPKGNTAGSE